MVGAGDPLVQFMHVELVPVAFAPMPFHAIAAVPLSKVRSACTPHVARTGPGGNHRTLLLELCGPMGQPSGRVSVPYRIARSNAFELECETRARYVPGSPAPIASVAHVESIDATVIEPRAVLAVVKM